jgi:hypothetical protein
VGRSVCGCIIIDKGRHHAMCIASGQESLVPAALRQLPNVEPYKSTLTCFPVSAKTPAQSSFLACASSELKFELQVGRTNSVLSSPHPGRAMCKTHDTHSMGRSRNTGTALRKGTVDRSLRVKNAELQPREGRQM